MSDIYNNLLDSLAEPGQPTHLFKKLEALTLERIGHQLFTLLYVDGNEVARIYSNRPEEYPVSGRKPMGTTPWGDLVLQQKRHFLGVNKDAIRSAFFDHVLIESMGLGSVINVPVVYDGACIGTMNLLDAEHHYREDHVPFAASLAPLLIPAFMNARHRAI